jgi:hypothetical protein
MSKNHKGIEGENALQIATMVETGEQEVKEEVVQRESKRFFKGEPNFLLVGDNFRPRAGSTAQWASTTAQEKTARENGWKGVGLGKLGRPGEQLQPTMR